MQSDATRNPIEELVALVCDASDGTSALDQVGEWLDQIGRPAAEIESTLALVRVAFMAQIKRSGAGESVARCDFCRKDEGEVRALVAASEVSICDECVELAREVIAERGGRADRGIRSLLRVLRRPAKR